MRATLVLLCLSGCLAFGERLPLENLGVPFSFREGRIEWTTTNALPPVMNVYNVSAARFSVALISNVVALAGFTNEQKAVRSLSPALRERDCSFEEEPAHKGITLSPQRGNISFHNSRAIALPNKAAVTNVPTDDEALRLARSVLSKLGLSESQFAKHGDGKGLLFWRTRQVHSRKRNGKSIREQTANGLYLVRAIDGVSFAGSGHFGGLYLLFGNDNRIAAFDLCWRNLSLAEKRPVVSRDRISEWIRTGKVFAELNPGLPPSIDKLVITNVIPHYFGVDSSEAQEQVYPFLTLEGFAEEGGKRSAIVLSCPASEER